MAKTDRNRRAKRTPNCYISGLVVGNGQSQVANKFPNHCCQALPGNSVVLGTEKLRMEFRLNPNYCSVTVKIMVLHISVPVAS